RQPTQMIDQQITTHFRLSEFDQPSRHGFPRVPYPERWIAMRLRPLCDALEVIRDALGGKPVHILSGYRTPPYNRAVGGEPQSQHMVGRAADIIVDGWAAEAVHATVLRLFRDGKIEIGGLGLYPDFVHVDVRKPQQDGHLAQWTGIRTARETGVII